MATRISHARYGWLGGVQTDRRGVVERISWTRYRGGAMPIPDRNRRLLESVRTYLEREGYSFDEVYEYAPGYDG